MCFEILKIILWTFRWSSRWRPRCLCQWPATRAGAPPRPNRMGCGGSTPAPASPGGSAPADAQHPPPPPEPRSPAEPATAGAGHALAVVVPAGPSSASAPPGGAAAGGEGEGSDWDASIDDEEEGAALTPGTAFARYCQGEAAAASGPSPDTTFAAAGPVAIGGSPECDGILAELSCTSCGFLVLRFGGGCRWVRPSKKKSGADYYFFRNNNGHSLNLPELRKLVCPPPPRARLRPAHCASGCAAPPRPWPAPDGRADVVALQLEPAPGFAAYACQCSWQSVCAQKALRWGTPAGAEGGAGLGDSAAVISNGSGEKRLLSPEWLVRVFVRSRHHGPSGLIGTCAGGGSQRGAQVEAVHAWAVRNQAAPHGPPPP